jgi:hypothetical protein
MPGISKPDCVDAVQSPPEAATLVAAHIGGAWSV